MNENKHGSRKLPPANLNPKYGQTGNVKPLTASRGLPFICGYSDGKPRSLSSLVLRLRLTTNVNLFHVRDHEVSPFLVFYFSLFQHIY